MTYINIENKYNLCISLGCTTILIYIINIYYIYIYSLLLKLDFKKLIQLFHKVFKKSFNPQLVDLK